MRTAIKVLLFALLCLGFTGCVVNTAAQLRPETTLPIAPTAAPDPEATPTPLPESPAPNGDTPGVNTLYDALGEYISGAAHFQRYLTFENIRVYEQEEDTFLDAVVVNTYPQTLVCALDVVFTDEEGQELSSSRTQTRDGQYVLRLAPGENVIFSRIDTDVSLTDRDFELIYNESLGVLPG